MKKKGVLLSELQKGSANRPGCTSPGTLNSDHCIWNTGASLDGYVHNGNIRSQHHYREA